MKRAEDLIEELEIYFGHAKKKSYTKHQITHDVTSIKDTHSIMNPDVKSAKSEWAADDIISVEVLDADGDIHRLSDCFDHLNTGGTITNDPKDAYDYAMKGIHI